MSCCRLSKEEVFQKMDAITNAIFDRCELKIAPSIAVQEIKGKAIIVVEIAPLNVAPLLWQKSEFCGGYLYLCGWSNTPCRALSCV